MAKVNWSPEAIQDFFKTLSFIEQEDVAIARKIEAEALQKADDRAIFPESGGIVPELGDPNLSEVLIRGTFRLIYELRGEEIIVIAFMRTTRQLEKTTLKKRK